MIEYKNVPKSSMSKKIPKNAAQNFILKHIKNQFRSSFPSHFLLNLKLPCIEFYCHDLRSNIISHKSET